MSPGRSVGSLDRSNGARPKALSAVAGAIRHDLLAIAEGGVERGVTLAVLGDGAADLAAVENLGLARRTHRSAGLDRRRIGHVLEWEAFAVAEPHAKGDGVPGAAAALAHTFGTQWRRRHAAERRRRRFGIGLRGGGWSWELPKRKSKKPACAGAVMPKSATSAPLAIKARHSDCLLDGQRRTANLSKSQFQTTTRSWAGRFPASCRRKHDGERSPSSGETPGQPPIFRYGKELVNGRFRNTAARHRPGRSGSRRSSSAGRKA